MKNLWSIIVLMSMFSFNLQAQNSLGEIMGKVFEKSETEEPAFGATFWVTHSGA